MWYRYYLTVPRGTTRIRPARKEIQLPEGVVTKVRVRFPPGPRGEGNYAWGDDEAVEMGEHVRNIVGWHYWLEGYAPDTIYGHTVWWDFNVLEREYAETWGPIQELVRLLKDVMGL